MPMYELESLNMCYAMTNHFLFISYRSQSWRHGQLTLRNLQKLPVLILRNITFLFAPSAKGRDQAQLSLTRRTEKTRLGILGHFLPAFGADALLNSKDIAWNPIWWVRGMTPFIGGFQSPLIWKARLVGQLLIQLVSYRLEYIAICFKWKNHV